MDTPQERFDETLMDFVDRHANLDLTSEDATTAMINLERFSKCRPAVPEQIVPTTKWGKIKLGASHAWDNETTRTIIKAGGAFAGVAVVAWTTIHKDHIIERQALSQANQRNS